MKQAWKFLRRLLLALVALGLLGILGPRLITSFFRKRYADKPATVRSQRAAPIGHQRPRQAAANRNGNS